MRQGLRLAPAAGATWAAAAAAIFVPQLAGPAAIALWALTIVAVWTAARVRPEPARAPGRVRAPGRAAAVVLVLACAACAATTSHVALAQPVRAGALELSGAGRAVTVEAVVVGKVEQRATGALSFDVLVTSVSRGDERREARFEASVRVAPDAVDDRAALDLGSVVRAQGTAREGYRGARAVLVLEARRGLEVLAAPVGVLAGAAALRRSLVASVAGLPEPGAGLIPGLAVGDTGTVGAELDVAMKASSLSHLTAVSGANCAIVVGIAFVVAAALGLGRTGRVIAGLLTLAGFVVLVTPEPSVVRAAAMAAIGMLGLLLGRPAAGMTLLSIAVVVLLVVDPWLAASLGFALSASATASLLLLARPLAAGLSRAMPRTLALALSVPLAAQLACGPLLILIDPTVPLYGVAANLLAAPAAPIATVVGLAACLLAPVPVVQSGLAALAWVPAAWIAGTAVTSSRLPGAGVPWPEGVGGALALAVAGGAVAAVIALSRSTARLRVARRAAGAVIAVAIGVSAGGVALTTVASPWTLPRAWSLVACDVGQGDAVVIRSGGATALIDTGPDPARLRACLDRIGVTRLDLVVLTHFDTDHAGGLDAVRGRIGTLVHGPPNAADAELLAALSEDGAQVVAGEAGLAGELGDSRWRVLWPPRGSRAFTEGNDASVVLDVRGGALPSVLLLGDLSASPQRALAASGALQPPYDVVKVAHHGSADQHPALYAVAEPGVALVTVGARNPYGHPREELLAIIDATGAVTARTDEEGMIALWRSSHEVAVWRERRAETAERRRTTGRPRPRRASGPAGSLERMATRARRAPAKARSAIPQLSWRNPQPAPIVLVSGPEEICAERATAGIRDFLRAEDASLEVTDLRADDYASGTLLAVTSPSLFGEPRLVRVTGVEKCSDAFLSEAISYLAAPQDGATVVLRHTGVSVRGKKLLDAIRAGEGGGVEVACAAVKRDSDRFDFAAGEFQTARKRIAPIALRTLVSAFADDLADLAAACQQLIADVPGDITEQIVERYYGGRVETSAFTVADTAIAGRYGDALIALRHALASGADPVPLVAAIASKLRTMARVAGSREPAAALASRLGLKDWQVDRARRDLAGWTETTLGIAIQHTARADLEVKGGSRDPVFALERLVTIIATRAPYGS